MKRKSVNAKIDAFIKKFKSLQKKGVNEKGKETLSSLKVMESDLKIAIGLQKEVQKLKDTLKIRKKELVEKVKNFKSLRQGIKKARKNDAKASVIIKSLPVTRVGRKKTTTVLPLDSEIVVDGTDTITNTETSPKTRVVRKKGAGRPRTSKTGTTVRRTPKPKTPVLSQN